MYEVELKVPAALAPVRDRLADLDAEARGGALQVDTYYDAPDRSFADTDEALRIRRERTRSVSDASGSEGPDPREDDGGGGSEPRSGGSGGVGDDGWDRAALTYKGPKVDDSTQTREEHETDVDDPAATAALLESLGYEAAPAVRKERRYFEYRGVTVTLDDVDGVGTFVEVELEVDDESAVASARERARDVLSNVGLDPDDGIRESYLELVLAGE